MKGRLLAPLLSIALLVGLSLPKLSVAQEGEEGQAAESAIDAVEEVDQGFLDLGDPLVAIWPPNSMEGVEGYSEGLEDLIGNNERALRQVKEYEDQLKRIVDEAKDNEDIVKAKIDVAKKASDADEQARLEALRDAHKNRREYLDRIRKIREQEGKVFEARINYLKKLREGYAKAEQLANERHGERLTRELLGLEEEMLSINEEASKRAEKLASESKKLASQRQDAFKVRKKIFEEQERAGSN